jgi:toxin YoeB
MDILKDPRKGIGRPERLRYQADEEDVWSRRINEKDRLVYVIFEETTTVLIQSALGHYGDH